jgi:hypothetical protein
MRIDINMSEYTDMKEELIEELEAFDPNFRINYHNLGDAVKAASFDTPYIMDLYEALHAEHDALVAAPDVLKYKEVCDALDAESALPFKLNDIGTFTWGDPDNVY